MLVIGHSANDCKIAFGSDPGKTANPTPHAERARIAHHSETNSHHTHTMSIENCTNVDVVK